MSTSDPEHLDSHQRDTLLQLFQHPTSHNIAWPAVLALLEAAGSVERHPDGRYLVRLGGEKMVLTRPKHKDIEVEQVVDLRRMLTSAGYGPLVEEMEHKGKET